VQQLVARPAVLFDRTDDVAALFKRLPKGFLVGNLARAAESDPENGDGRCDFELFITLLH